MNEVKAHKLFGECCVNFLCKGNEILGEKNGQSKTNDDGSRS